MKSLKSKGEDDLDCLCKIKDYDSLWNVNDRGLGVLWKHKDRGLWVLWKTKARTLSPVKDKGEDFDFYER